jgi:hypothetical protein
MRRSGFRDIRCIQHIIHAHRGFQMTHLQEWYEARKDCLEAPINDPDYRIKLNRLSEAEDALYKQAIREKKRNDELNEIFVSNLERIYIQINGDTQ